MSARTSGTLAASLVFFLTGCGGPARPEPATEEPTPAAVASPGRVSIQVKDFT